MMNALLRTETLGFLHSFKQRRIALLSIRGFFAFLATAIILLMLVALLDRAILIADGLRWSLSLLAYTTAMFAAWCNSLRHLRIAHDDRGIARLVEQSETAFDAKLLSAVELGDSQSLAEAEYDSVELRTQLQDEVAHRIKRLNLTKLLPIARVYRSALALLIGLSLCFGLILIPTLNFAAFFQRAALPFSNLARPTNIHIAILAPLPADTSIPTGDEISIVVESTGARPEQVHIEIVDPVNGRSLTEMRRDTLARFSTTVTVDNNLEYRIQADDGLTRFYSITALPRPTVTEFEKTIHYPDYTQLPDVTTLEAMGDIKALAGSRIGLRLPTSLPVRHAELHVESAEDKTDQLRLPLTISENGRMLTGDLLVSAARDAYRVHLESKDGVTNKFSPLFEIRSTPDLAPTIQLALPAQDQEVVQGDTLLVEGYAEDDYGLASVMQHWKIANAEWQSQPFELDRNSKRMDLSRPWQIAANDFPVGSIVLLKLSATDGYGTTSESGTIRLYIRKPLTSAEDRSWTATQGALARQLTQVERLANQTRDAVHKAEASTRKPVTERDSADLMRIAKAESLLRKTNESLEQFRESIKTAMPEAPARSDEVELLAVARMLSQAQRTHLEPALADLRTLAQGDQPPSREEHKNFRSQSNESAGKIAHAARLMRNLAAAENAHELAGEAKRLAQRQDRITDEAKRAEDDPTSRTESDKKAWNNRQAFNEQSSKNLQESLRRLAEIADGERGRVEGLRHHLEHRDDDLARYRENQKRTEALSEAKKQFSASKRLQDAYRHADRNAEQLARKLAEQARRARKELLRQQLAANPHLNEVQHEANRMRDTIRNGEEQALQPNEQKRFDIAQQQFKDNVRAAAKRMRDNAELEEMRKRANHQAASDQSLLARALEAQEKQSPNNLADAKQLVKKVQQIERARKSIEADAQARELLNSLLELAHNEKQATSRGATEQLDDWQITQERLGQLPKTLQQAGVDKATLKQAKENKDSDESRAVAKEMERRQRELRKGDLENSSVERQLGRLAQRARNQQLAASHSACNSREKLAELTPSVPKRMQQLANDLNEQATRNKQIADSDLTDSFEKAVQEMARRNAESANQLKNLTDDLRREANARELSRKEARQRARDADDAIATLDKNQVAEKIAQAQSQLQKAAGETSSESPKSQSVSQAAEQQQAISNQLDRLSKQLADQQSGRAALRDGERDNPINEKLKQEHQRAEKLAEEMKAAEENPEDVLAALEAELARNPAMQETLKEIQNDAAQQAAADLAQAAEDAKQLAERVKQPADTKRPAGESASEQAKINEQVDDAHQSMARAGRHAKRLGQSQAAKSLETMSNLTQQAAKTALEATRAALAKESPPGESALKVTIAKDKLQQLAKSASNVSAASQAKPSPTVPQTAEGRALAKALDELDRAIHATGKNDASLANKPKTPDSNQPAQSSPNGDGQPPATPAQQNFVEALQAVAQAMANTRQSQSQSQKQKQQSQSQPPQMAKPSQSAEAKTAAGTQSQFGKQLDQSMAEGFTPQDVIGADPRRWGDLPKQMAEDVLQSRQDAVSPEYRQAIENYYKALGQKARARK